MQILYFEKTALATRIKLSLIFLYLRVYRCFLKTPYPNIHFHENIPEPSTSFAPHRIFNVGSNNPTNLLNFIELLESSLGVKALKIMKPMQPGDVQETFADINCLKDWVNYSPKTLLDSGILKFAKWYKEYFNSYYFLVPFS